jgi:hippurate hydrolase
MLADWYEGQRAASLGWLRHLHRHPETGFEETGTARFVADRLESFGFAVATGVGGSGVVGTLRGAAGPGRRIAFRAELDALPMEERTALSYRSQTPGRFHGCGHDGHAVTALTAAAWLAAHRDFAGEARFVFQPAEELLAGARAMLADGLFERFPCDEIYALHNMPGLPAGHVAVPQGPALASADDIDVTIRANGAHGAMPHTGEDAVAAAAFFIGSVQQAATRVADARRAGVISFGRIAGGTARNILPDAVRIEGTLRTDDAALRDRLARLLRDAGKATEALHGVRAEVRVTPVAPVAVNDAAAAAAVRASAARVVGAERVIGNARGVMASEDFAEFLARVPGAYFFIGQDGRAPHHPEYVFDPEIIPVGAAIFVDLARTRTAATPPPAPRS